MTRFVPGCLGIWPNGGVIFYLYDIPNYSEEMFLCNYRFEDNMVYSLILSWIPADDEELYD